MALRVNRHGRWARMAGGAAGLLAASLAFGGVVSDGAAPAGAVAPTAAGAYVWADQPTTASYTPPTAYSYDSAGGAITITRSAPGTYTVSFGGLGGLASRGGGTVDVTAYGSTAADCVAAGWSSIGSALVAHVDCDGGTGVGTDAEFTATFAADSTASPTLDYVWADDASSTIGSAYTPNSNYQFDSAATRVTVTHIATGAYDVALPGPVQVGGDVKVSEYGATGDSCEVVDWAAQSPGQVAEVDCFTSTGALTDATFTLTFAAAQNLLGVPTLQSAYVWANNATAAAYVPSTPYQYNSSGGTNSITRSSAGVYLVALPNQGQTAAAGDVQVSAFGSVDTHCQVGSWSAAGSVEDVTVRCFNGAGVATDSTFTMQWIEPPGTLTGMTWTAGATVPTPHLEGAAVALGGNVYDIAGGTADCTDTSTGAATAAVDVYDTATNTFSAGAPIPDARNQAPVAAVAGGDIYVIGGTASCGGAVVAPVDRYTPSTNTWTTLPAASDLPTSIQVPEVCGAAVGSDIYFFTSSGVGVLDTAANPPTWTVDTRSALLTPTSYCKATSVGSTNPSSSKARS